VTEGDGARERLGPYRAKRDLDSTPEPAGDERPAPSSGKPRFVIQQHDATRLHWDLRLERDGVLVSWAIPNGIPQDPRRNRKAVRTEDHPLSYLEFAGEIPHGQYGAGTMTIWDSGTYEPVKWTGEKVEVELRGERVSGLYGLFRVGPEESDWMIHRMSAPQDPDREELPRELLPMLATAAAEPPAGEGWAHEVKWDGVRALLSSEPGRLRIWSRNLLDLTGGYPELGALGRALGSREALLDGEIVAFDADGRPSFERLQSRMHLRDGAARRAAERSPIVYAIFDLLHLDGRALLERPWSERRAALEALRLEGPAWRTPAVHEDGERLLRATAEQGLEGVVAKRRDSRYEPGRRSRAWVKVRHRRSEQLAIGGWTPGKGARSERIGALLVGRRTAGGGLRYAGRVGSGIGEAALEDLGRRLAELERPGSPFTEGPAPPRGARWAEPRLTAEIEYGELTRAGVLRAPVYRGVHGDPFPPEPDREGGADVEVDGRALRLTNLGKVLYPATGFTKGDLIAYHHAIAPVLLPHLAGRPLTLKRYPDGVGGEFFYEKRIPSHAPDWVGRARVSSGRRGHADHVVVADRATLVWLGNLADLELHPSLSRAVDLEHPTVVAFDLDPGEPAGLAECCEVALVLRALFERLGLRCHAKTSGAKGMQVYLPLNRGEATYEATKPFARRVAETLEARLPELVVSRMSRDRRAGRVLVDWSQNDAHKTTVGVYSLRARERPSVSTPVAWEEAEACLSSRDPSLLRFSPDDVLARIERRGDLFAGVLSTRQALPAL